MGRIVLYTNLLCAKSAQIKKLVEQRCSRFVEVPLTGQALAEHFTRITGRKVVPLLVLNRKESLDAEEIAKLEESGTLEGKLKAALEESNDSKTGDDDVKDLAFDDHYEDDKLEEIYYKMRDPIDGLKMRVPTLKKDRYFKGSDFVSWAMKALQMTEAEAIRTGQNLKERGYAQKRHEDLKTSATAFTNDHTSWRLAEDTDPNCLNMRRSLTDGRSRTSTEIPNALSLSADIFLFIVFLSYPFVLDAGVQLYTRLLLVATKSGTDWNVCLKSPGFRKFLHLANNLQLANLTGLSDVDLISFFLNIYHTLLIHSAIVGGNPKKNAPTRYYSIAGMRFSVADIETGILRANRKPGGDYGKRFERADERLQCALTSFDPRVDFAMMASFKHACPIQIAKPDLLDDLLHRSAEIVCEETEVDLEKKTVVISPIFQAFGFDFGKGKIEILQWIDKYLPEERSIHLNLLIKNNPPAEVTVQYHTYSWDPWTRFYLQNDSLPPRMPSDELEDDSSAESAPSPKEPPLPAIKEPPLSPLPLPLKKPEEPAPSVKALKTAAAAPAAPVSSPARPLGSPRAPRLSSDEIHAAITLAGSTSGLGQSGTGSSSGRPRFYWEVDMAEVDMGAKIGQGAFGANMLPVVYKGEWAGTEVAIKQLIGDEFTPEQLNEFLKEINIMSQLRHPNIVLFLGACLQPPNIFYLTEFLPRGSLHAVLQKEVSLDWKLRVKMATDGAKGMTYLHMRSMLHRDIKSLNFLVDEHYVVKVADFGLSKVVQENTRANMNTRVGTLNWLAPETLADHGVYTAKSDVFSFGMVLWEILTQKAPYEGKNPIQVIRAIDAGDRPEIPADADAVFGQLIRDAWAQDPSKRPPFLEILQRLRKLLESLSQLQPTSQVPLRSSATSLVPPNSPGPRKES